MKKSFLIVLAALAASGCVPAAVVGGGAYAVSAGTSERGFGGTISDTQIQLGINRRWWDADADISKRLDLTVNEGRVLITGIARDSNQKMEASRLCWEVEGVQEVINEASVDSSMTAGSFAKDSWITTKLRTFLLFDGEIAGRNYTIDTINNVVYLMGYARNQQELDRVTNHASNIDGVERVVSYVRVGNEPVESPP
jgi:osmotically-inducible protein OsmY